MSDSNSEVIGKLAANIALEWLSKPEMSQYDILSGVVKDILNLLSQGSPETTAVLTSESIDSFVGSFKKTSFIRDNPNLILFLQEVLQNADPVQKNEIILAYCEDNKYKIDKRAYAHQTINKMKTVWINRSDMEKGEIKLYGSLPHAILITGDSEENFIPFFVNPRSIPASFKFAEKKAPQKTKMTSDTDLRREPYRIFYDNIRMNISESMNEATLAVGTPTPAAPASVPYVPPAPITEVPDVVVAINEVSAPIDRILGEEDPTWEWEDDDTDEEFTDEDDF